MSRDLRDLEFLVDWLSWRLYLCQLLRWSINRNMFIKLVKSVNRRNLFCGCFRSLLANKGCVLLVGLGAKSGFCVKVGKRLFHQLLNMRIVLKVVLSESDTFTDMLLVDSCEHFSNFLYLSECWFYSFVNPLKFLLRFELLYSDIRHWRNGR